MNSNDLQALGDGIQKAFGDSVRDVRVVRLGNPLKYAAGSRDPIRAQLPSETEVPSMIWVHEEDENKIPIATYLVLNAGQGKISDTELVYRNVIYVRKDNSQYVTAGTAGYNSEEYMYGTIIRPQRSIDITQFDMGLLRPTNPVSMQVMVTPFHCVLNSVAYYVPALVSASLASLVPVSGARAIQVRVNPVTRTLAYTNGTAFTYNAGRDDPTHENAFTNYPSAVPDTEILIGWVRLVTVTNVIAQRDIFNAQELISKGSSSGSGSDITTAYWITTGPLYFSDGTLVSVSP